MIYLHQQTTEWFSPFREGFFLGNFTSSKFHENKTLVKISKFENFRIYSIVQEYHQSVIQLDSDQVWHFDGPGLAPNC